MTKAWTENKAYILAYYETQKFPLSQVMLLMKQNHGFHASQRAYRQQFHNWGISKYNRKERPASHSGDGRMSTTAHRTRVSSSSSIACPSIYVTHVAKTPQGTPRPSHIPVSQPDRAHNMSAMPSPYHEMTSSYPTPVPTPASGFHDDGAVGHSRHNGVIQATVGRESPSSFLFHADSIAAIKSAQWQRRHDTHKQHDDSGDYKIPYSYPEALEYESSVQRKSSEYAWGYTHAHPETMDLDSHHDHRRVMTESPVSAHDDRTSHAAYNYRPLRSLAHSPSAFSDYNTECHQTAKPFYGVSHQYQEHDFKQRIWETSEATTPVTSAAAFETRRYTSMPSPAHSQGYPSSPRATKTMEEQLSVPRTLPISPASVPEIMVQPSLQRSSSEMQSQDHGSAYNPDALPATMDFTRTYNPAYTTRNSTIEAHPSPRESVASPAAISTPCHASMYPGSHLV